MPAYFHRRISALLLHICNDHIELTSLRMILKNTTDYEVLLKAIVPKSDTGFQYEEDLVTKHFASHNKNILYYPRNIKKNFQDYTGLIP